jgi:hypothetical protein
MVVTLQGVEKITARPRERIGFVFYGYDLFEILRAHGF